MQNFGSLKYLGTEAEEKGARGAEFRNFGRRAPAEGLKPLRCHAPPFFPPAFGRTWNDARQLRRLAPHRCAPPQCRRAPSGYFRAFTDILCILRENCCCFVDILSLSLSPYILLPIPTCVTVVSQPRQHLCPGARCVGARFSCRGKAPTQKRAPTRKCA